MRSGAKTRQLICASKCLEEKTPVPLLAPLHPKFNRKYQKVEPSFRFGVRPGEFQVSLPSFGQLYNLQLTHLKVKRADTYKGKHFAVINGRDYLQWFQ